jgi:hypothetical protein
MTMTGIDVPQDFRSIGCSASGLAGSAFTLVRDRQSRTLLFVAGRAVEFDGESSTSGKVCPLTPENARALAVELPWLRPCRLREDSPSFGFGDRLGLATPGHIRAVVDSGIFPILAQQSVRENARTGRTFGQVLADAVFAAFREGFKSGFGADADHLKRIDDAVEAARLGYTFFTCDPGDFVQPADSMSADELRTRFAELPSSDDLRARYVDRSHRTDGALTLHFSEEELLRAAVKYFGAVEHAVRMYRALVDEIGPDFDYEVSVDETDSPTTPLEHLFVALELRHRGVSFVSLAPRFLGAMEKGVDWSGDLDALKRDLAQHAAVARTAGGHRLSLHSGSDKFSIYPLVAGATGGRCHVKTAGTSYLVALGVIANCDPPLFREIVARSLSGFAEDKATYHISADPSRFPPPDTVSDEDLHSLVSTHDSRQVLHVAYGSILRSSLGDDLRGVLAENEDEHHEALVRHMRRHLDALEVSSNEGP